MSLLAKPEFELAGPKTGILMCIFWANINPDYERWGLQMLAELKDAADVLLVAHDESVTVPKGLKHVVVEPVTHIHQCFQAGVEKFAKLGVGSFFYAAADDIYHPQKIKRLLQVTQMESDIAFGNYTCTESRNPDWRTMKDGIDDFLRAKDGPFNVPETSAYRTRIFTDFPTMPRMRFLNRTVAHASKENRRPKAQPVGGTGFYYYNHGQQGDHWPRGGGRSFQSDL